MYERTATDPDVLRGEASKEAEPISPSLLEPNLSPPEEISLSSLREGEPLEAQVLANIRAHTLEYLTETLLSGGKAPSENASGVISILLSPPCLLNVDISEKTRPGLEDTTPERVTTIKASVISSKNALIARDPIVLELCESATSVRSKAELAEFYTKVTDECLEAAQLASHGTGLVAIDFEFQAKILEKLVATFGESLVLGAIGERFPELGKLIVEHQLVTAKNHDALQTIDQGLRNALPPLSLSGSFASFFPNVDSLSMGGSSVPLDGAGAAIILGVAAVAYTGLASVGGIHTLVFGGRHTISDRQYSTWSEKILQTLKVSEMHGIDAGTATKVLTCIRNATVSDWSSENRVTRPTANKIVEATMYALRRLDKDSVEAFLEHVQTGGAASGESRSSRGSIKVVTKRVKDFFESYR